MIWTLPHFQSIKPDFEKSRETLHSMSKALFNEREKLIQEVLVRVYGDEKIIEVWIRTLIGWQVSLSDWWREPSNQNQL